MRILVAVFAVGVGAFGLFYGCGGSTEGIEIDHDAGPSACTTTNQTLCRQACQCGDEAGICAFTDDGVGSVTFETQEACEAYMVDQVCQAAGSDEVDFEACSAALDGKCVNVTGVRALARPEVCFTRKPDAGADGGDAGDGG